MASALLEKLKIVTTEAKRSHIEGAVDISWAALAAKEDPQGRRIGTLLVEAGAAGGGGGGEGGEWDCSGDGNENDENGNENRIGEGGGEVSKRQKPQNSCRRRAGTGRDMGGKRKKCRRERVGSIAANPDNLGSNKEAGGGAQGAQGSSKICTNRESISPLSRLIRGFRTRMTGPDCAVMCNLINTHTHVTSTIDQPLGGSMRVP